MDEEVGSGLRLFYMQTNENPTAVKLHRGAKLGDILDKYIAMARVCVVPVRNGRDFA